MLKVFLSLVSSGNFLRNGFQRPINCFELKFEVKPFKGKSDMFSYPELFKHGVKLFFDIDVILKSEFDLFFAFKNLMVLVLKENLAEGVEFWKKGDNVLVGFELNFLEKEGSGLCKCVEEFRVNCGVKRETQRDVGNHSKDCVPKVGKVLFFNKISRRDDFELPFDEGIKFFCHGGDFLVEFRDIFSKVLFNIKENLKPVPQSNGFKLRFNWVVKLVEELPLELDIPGVRNDIISGDVGVPALLFIEVLVNGLTCF